MSRDRIAEHVGAGRSFDHVVALATGEPAAQDWRMQLVPTRLIEAVQRRLAGAPISPEEALRRRGERLEAEARMRGEIDRAVRLWGRTNRYVR
jgi:hypothetical protein